CAAPSRHPRDMAAGAAVLDQLREDGESQRSRLAELAGHGKTSELYRVHAAGTTGWQALARSDLQTDARPLSRSSQRCCARAALDIGDLAEWSKGAPDIARVRRVRNSGFADSIPGQRRTRRGG